MLRAARRLRFVRSWVIICSWALAHTVPSRFGFVCLAVYGSIAEALLSLHSMIRRGMVEQGSCGAIQFRCGVFGLWFCQDPSRIPLLGICVYSGYSMSCWAAAGLFVYSFFFDSFPSAAGLEKDYWYDQRLMHGRSERKGQVTAVPNTY